MELKALVSFCTRLCCHPEQAKDPSQPLTSSGLGASFHRDLVSTFRHATLRHRLFSLRRSPDFRVPDSLEVHKIALHLDSRNSLPQARRRAPQLLLVMRGLSLRVATEGAGQASVGAAIGVHHQNDSSGPMQPYRLANLIQNERPVAFLLWRSQALGASGHLDRIGIDHTDALEKLAKSQLKAIVEAPEYGGVAVILFPRSVEMKDFLHESIVARDGSSRNLT